MKLQIIPIGVIDPGLVEMVEQGIETVLPAQVRLGKAIEPPHHAYDAERGQYSAEAILNALSEERSENQEHIIGVADLDLFIPDLTFVFGAALRRVALVSVIRLRQEFYNLGSDKGLLARRILTEAVHEIGHSYGMRHCFEPGCVMFFSHGICDTDRKGFDFCASCGEMLTRVSKPLLEISEDDPRLAPSLNIML